MKRLLITLAAVLSLTLSARADTYAPCSPNCSLGDPYDVLNISIPPTWNTLWTGSPEEVPDGVYRFGVFATAATVQPDLLDIIYAAYATSDFDYTISLRHARTFAMLNWISYENLEPGWSKDSSGLVSFSDPPPLSSENPEPSTWLLMATGIVGLIFIARNQRFKIIMSSNQR